MFCFSFVFLLWHRVRNTSDLSSNDEGSGCVGPVLCWLDKTPLVCARVVHSEPFSRYLQVPNEIATSLLYCLSFNHVSLRAITILRRLRSFLDCTQQRKVNW
jgi:hypothetical protein